MISRIIIFGAGYLLAYSLIAFSDGYTTNLVAQALPNEFLELNPKLESTELIGFLRLHLPRAALFTAMIVLSFVIASLSPSVAVLIDYDRRKFVDRFGGQVPGIAAITVLFLMLIATPNNLMVYSFRYGIFDLIFQLLSITDSNMKIAITPFLVVLLFILFSWPAYVIYNKIENRLLKKLNTNSSLPE